MPEEDPLTVQPHPSGGYGVLVPCPPEEFVEFISKLLGKPQIAEGRFSGPFNIELTDIENFHYLIEQRNREQNKGRLVQFTVNIHFDDGTSAEVESLSGLKTYSEVRPLVSTGVTLTWVYLVTFHNVSVPEKQQIEVTLSTRRKPLRHVVHVVQADPFPFFTSGEDMISYRVSYTARTWGADIENLLKGHIRSLIIPEHSALRRFVRKWHTYVMNFIALGTYAVFLRAGMYGADWIAHARHAGYDQSIAGAVDKTDLVIRKMDYIYSTISGTGFISVISVIMLYLGGTLILSYFGATAVTESIEQPIPSFVLLTRNAVHAKTAELTKYERNWKTFFGAFLLASLAGVVGNIITWFVWG